MVKLQVILMWSQVCVKCKIGSFLCLGSDLYTHVKFSTVVNISDTFKYVYINSDIIKHYYCYLEVLVLDLIQPSLASLTMFGTI